MRSIRAKVTLLTVLAVSVAIVVTTVISVFYVSNLGHTSSEQALSLLCETGKNNLENYFKSVEQSVKTVSSLIDANLDTMEDSTFNEKLHNHVEQSRTVFREAAENANGVLTYYYRFDPEITNATGEKGFWYTNLDGAGFIEHTVTDISDDQFECLWFYTPKNTGKPVWLPPYVTDNLDEYVISYNVPVYKNSSFIGVVGIEISYHTLGKQIENIKIHKTGFAYIVENENGSIIYHPHIDILSMPESERPAIPPEFVAQFKAGSHHVSYTFQGVKKHAYWLNLTNGMSIVVAVPTSEVNETGLKIIGQITIVAVAVIAAFVTASILFSRRITKPLKELTDAAERINNGDYNFNLEYKENDEIGALTTTVNRLVTNLGGYIDDLNSIAYSDALTSVHNKSAFDLALAELQTKIDNSEEVEFAIAVFDCDGLKQINDKYGHDKGNVYLKNSSLLIMRTFQNSEVYRIGGDEFVVILKDDDFQNRDQLKALFIEKSAIVCSFAKEEWEKIRVSVGLAVYDPEMDETAEDVMIHADHLMYQNKRERKKSGK